MDDLCIPIRVGDVVRIVAYRSKLPGYRDSRNPVGRPARVVAMGGKWGTDNDPAYTVRTDDGHRYAVVASELEAQS